MKLDILAIAAHPDDVELSCGGTLMIEKSRGKSVGIVDLTRGELGTRGTAEIRTAEAEAALLEMELDLRINLDFPDGFFENTRPYQLKVIETIRRFKPTIILTNAPTDRHPDHGRAAQLVRDSAWLSGLRKIESWYDGQLQEHWRPAYVFNFIQDKFLAPDFVVDISPVMEQKLKAIRCFKSQFDTVADSEPQTYISTPEFLKSIIDRASSLGRSIGVPYGEGFIAEKKPGISTLDSLICNVT